MPTAVLNLTQKISAFLCPSHPSLLSERASRSARAFRRHLLCGSNTAPVGADDPVRPYRTRISPQTSAKPSLPTAGRTESSAPTILSYFFRIPFAAGSKGEAPLVERESPENRPKGSLVVSFLFFTGRGDSFLSPKRERKEWGRKHIRRSFKGAPQNQTVTQQSGHSLERKKEQADTELSASAESAVQRASSDAAAILFFLRKEAKRMGA